MQQEAAMQQREVDVAIIGAGTAGMSAYRAAKASGKRVLLIEGGPYGTTCARVGCMPSKLLIAAAEAAHAVAAAPGFGVLTEPPRIDGVAVLTRVRSERDRFVGFVLESVEGFAEDDKLRGYARFLDAHTLQVDEHTLVKAERIVIATGSSANIPEQLHAAGKRVAICDDVFEWPDLPRRVAVIGTGVIALELGQALARLGVKVTIFGRRDRVAHLTDPQVLACARAVLTEELDLRFNTKILGTMQEEGEVVLCSQGQDGVERADRFDYILSAAGRIPHLHDLGLEHTGLTLDARGIPLYHPFTMQCGDSNIFIAGDADDERPLLHEAADQGRIAGENAARMEQVLPGLRRAPIAVAFCDPQIASVGQSWQELQQSMDGYFVCGEVSFANQGRSRVMLQNRGLLRVYADCRTGRFLGAEMIGPRAEHLAHLLAWACQNQMTVANMLDMPFYHPVIEEGLRTALRELQQQLKFGCPDMGDCRGDGGNDGRPGN
jgi:dihydrolipoamide dehydrogenase